MGRQINLNGLAPVFRGSDAVRAGVLSRHQLRGPAVRRLFQGVYSPVGVAETHELYCTGAWLVLAPSADGLYPEPQHWIEDSRGQLARVDLAFVAQRVAFELP